MQIQKIKNCIYFNLYINNFPPFFCFSGPDSDKLCRCGLEKSKHKPYLEDSAEEWHMPDNTFERINPAHGRLPNKAWV
jgi:hypothetical protein